MIKLNTIKSKQTSARKKAMLVALKRSLGIVTTACRLAGVHKATHYRWLGIDGKYKHAVNEMEEVALDFAEAKLLESIENGSVTATIFYLKTKGKKRGYIEKTEVEQDISLKVKDFNMREVIKRNNLKQT